MHFFFFTERHLKFNLICRKPFSCGANFLCFDSIIANRSISFLKFNFFFGYILKYETKIINKTISAVENEKKETAKFHIKQHPTEKSSVVYCIFHDTWGIFHLPVVNIHFLNSDDLYISAMVSCNDFPFWCNSYVHVHPHTQWKHRDHLQFR